MCEKANHERAHKQTPVYVRTDALGPNITMRIEQTLSLKKRTVLTDVQAANTPNAVYAWLKNVGPLGSQVVTAYIQLNLNGGFVARQPKQQVPVDKIYIIRYVALWPATPVLTPSILAATDGGSRPGLHNWWQWWDER
jgi:hypothetical protein